MTSPSLSHPVAITFVPLLTTSLSHNNPHAFIPPLTIHPSRHHQASSSAGIIISSTSSSSSFTLTSHLSAKNKQRNKKDNNDEEDEWYSPVSPTASPDTVFWEEMERRRLLNTSYDDGLSPNTSSGSESVSPIDMVGKIGTAASTDPSSIIGSGSGSISMTSTIASQSTYEDYSSASAAVMMTGNSNNNQLSTKNPGVTVAEERSAESTLTSYALYAVSDNYLYNDDEDEETLKSLGILRNDMSLWEGDDPTLEEENAELERQLDEWERELFGLGEEDDGVDGSVLGGSSPYFDPSLSDEPWDRYGQSRTAAEDEDNDDEDGNSLSAFQKNLQRKMEMVRQSRHGDLLLDYDDDHPEEAKADSAKEEEEYVKSLSGIGITSPRLENAAVNPKAKAFFQRKPDELQGYDQMWVSAIDQPCIQNLHGIFMDYGVQFADNFADWELGTEEDGLRSIEDIASFKARKVYEVTGLPCIASRTSFEVEPIRPEDLEKVNEEAAATLAASGKNLKQTKPPSKSPRVVTGYRFNDVGEHVDQIIQALMPFSEPTRVTRFRSCVCYYDGDMEIFEYGELDCDIYFSGSIRTFIPMSQALNSMLKTLQLALDLQFQKWLQSAVNDGETIY